MANQLVFLFSPRNEDCIEMWKILKEKNILNTLIKINVDDPKLKIPNNINVLPSILVRGQQMIQGKDAIIKYFNIPPVQTNKQQNMNQPTVDTPNSDNKESGKTLPPLTDVPFTKQNEAMFINTNELGSNWSDNYSFINSDATQKHSFGFIEDTNKSSRINNENASRSGKKSALEIKMETMMNKRNEIKPFKRV